jgi:hypothetical protein
MSVTRFTLYVSDPAPVFRWLAEHGGHHVVRQQATQFTPGWNVKVALGDASIAELFRIRWADDLLTLENQRKAIAAHRLWSAEKRSPDKLSTSTDIDG